MLDKQQSSWTKSNIKSAQTLSNTVCPKNNLKNGKLCVVLYWTVCLFPSLSILPSPTASLIEIILSSAFSVTHTQRWDMSLPPQSVSVTELTLGWDSGHFAHFFFSSSLSPPLSTHSAFGAQMEPLQAKGSFSCAPYLLKKRLLQGKERKKYQWTTSAVICVQ